MNGTHLYDGDSDDPGARTAEIVREPVPQLLETALRDTKFTSSS